MMYGIKGWLFIGEGQKKIPLSHKPFEAITGYAKAKEFVESTIDITNKALIRDGIDAPAYSGYMITIIPEDKWKEEK